MLSFQQEKEGAGKRPACKLGRAFKIVLPKRPYKPLNAILSPTDLLVAAPGRNAGCGLWHLHDRPGRTDGGGGSDGSFHAASPGPRRVRHARELGRLYPRAGVLRSCGPPHMCGEMGVVLPWGVAASPAC